MASIELSDIRKVYPGGHEAVKGISLADQRRRIPGAGRTVRLRQVDAAAHDRRARNRHRGHDQDRRAGGQRHRAGRARHRHGVPELRALSAHDGAPEPRLWPEEPQDAQGRDRKARRRGRPDPRDRPVPRPQAAPAFRRPAPARRHGPGDRARAQGVPVRRAALQPRRQAARADARRDPPAAAAPEDDQRLCHPRPARGDDAGRPAGGHECRADRAGRHAGRAVRAAADPLRRRLHRLAADEFHDARRRWPTIRPPSTAACPPAPRPSASGPTR